MTITPGDPTLWVGVIFVRKGKLPGSRVHTTKTIAKKERKKKERGKEKKEKKFHTSPESDLLGHPSVFSTLPLPARLSLSTFPYLLTMIACSHVHTNTYRSLCPCSAALPNLLSFHLPGTPAPGDLFHRCLPPAAYAPDHLHVHDRFLRHRHRECNR